MSAQTIIEMLNSAIDAKMVEVHTALPVEVVAVNVETQTVNCKIVVHRITQDDSILVFDILTEVPIGYTQTLDYNISFPINIGDTGQVIFNERQLDNWVVNGEIKEPDDFRKHSLSDGLFLPNFYNRQNLITGLTTSALEIRTADNATKFSLDKSGKITMDCANYEVNASATYTINSPAVEINASTSFTVNSPSSEFTGGTVTNDGTSIDNTHTHTQNPDAAGNTQVPTNPPS